MNFWTIFTYIGLACTLTGLFGYFVGLAAGKRDEREKSEQVKNFLRAKYADLAKEVGR
jgi:membrane protein YqaA with SNARE-associated domain